VAFSLPFESLQAFKLETDGMSSAFRAGLVAWNGARVGLVRIKNFSMRQYPSECERTWSTSPKHARSDAKFDDLVTDAWFTTLAAQLRRFRTERVDILLVDVGSNSGGNDSGEWTPRLLTPKAVRSARLLMSAAPVAQTYFDEQIAAIKTAQGSDSTAGLQAKAQQSLAFFAAASADLANRHCDMSWVWQEQRAFDPQGCSRLIDAGFASGAVAEMAPSSYRDRRAAAKIYWPATVDPWRGAWTGRVYVLTNATSYSAAEMFAAVMQDNAIAKIVGVRTGGDGCGFMEDTPPVVLPHSHLRFRMPNCVRLRADGSSEVAGIAPDLPIAAIDGESPRARAARLLSTVVGDAKSSGDQPVARK
jgi:C-terminal processing protease CtpA/Prc